MKKTVKLFMVVCFLASHPAIVFAQSVLELIEQGKVEELNATITQDPALVDLPLQNETADLPIHAAARLCSVPMIESLLKAGAKVNAVNGYGHSPAHIAAANCPVDILKYLVENGANTNVRTEADHLTPLHFAANRQEAPEVIEFLISQGLDIDAPSKSNNTTPLIQAIKNGNRPMIEFLISKGADARAGYVLNEAVQSGATTLDLFAYLIEKGANVNGGTPLITAISYGKLDFARLLAEHGADINADGVMSAAANTGDVDFLDYLVGKGGDVNLGDRTPLMSAAQAGDLSMVRYLLSKNADVNKATQYGNYTALSLAVWHGHREVALVLLKNGAQPDVFIHAGLGDVGELKKYELEELIHTRDEVGRTPLYAAIIGQEKRAVKYLIEKGAPVNDKTKVEWMTPLHQAVETRNRDLVHLLLDHGADVHAKLNESLYVRSGYTPLDIARENNDEFMIKLLEKYLNE